jgi:NADPH:quinone reductase-like Zn-dependent oxidoreductase
VAERNLRAAGIWSAPVRALVLPETGPPEVLRVEERPDPEPGTGEVRIAVRAAGVNFAELMARVGLYPDAPKPPCVLGYEVAGEVEAVAEGVDGVSVGDRVISGTRFGGYAEKVVVGAEETVPLPEGWSFEEGAAMPVNYATAYGCLVRYGGLREGERVLVQAAAGGVGSRPPRSRRSRGRRSSAPPRRGSTRPCARTASITRSTTAARTS